MIEFRLREALAKKNKTMADVNKETGISKNALSQLGNGSSKGIQFSTLDKILNSLKIPVQELIAYIPDSFSNIIFSFNYDESKTIDLSVYKSIGGTLENDFEYVSDIDFKLPDFRVTVEHNSTIVTAPCELSISYKINETKELTSVDIQFKKKDSVDELIVVSVFSGDHFEDALINYIIELSTELFPDEIENVGHLTIQYTQK